jgi:hypothetical protein
MCFIYTAKPVVGMKARSAAFFANVLTDKKENQVFPIYKEIQSGAVAKSYMTYGLLIYGEIFTHFFYFLIY